MKPLVSFIITYHNEPEAFLNDCLESIRALPLSEGEYEIVIVDDGSTSPLFAERMGVRLVRQEQAGLSVARNTGISHAVGKYIQFVDADDCLIPSAYGAVLEALKEGKADIVLFRMTTALSTSSHSGGEGTGKVIWSGGGISFLQCRNLRAAACGYAFRHDILGDLQFYPKLLHEDELFTPQLFLRAKSVIELKANAYFYRQHEGTITHTRSGDRIRKRLNDIHFILNELRSSNEPPIERRLRQLTVDYLQKTWTQTHSLPELRHRIAELRGEGFLPLPLRCYSPRYLAVALFVNIYFARV